MCNHAESKQKYYVLPEYIPWSQNHTCLDCNHTQLEDENLKMEASKKRQGLPQIGASYHSKVLIKIQTTPDIEIEKSLQILTHFTNQKYDERGIISRNNCPRCFFFLFTFKNIFLYVFNSFYGLGMVNIRNKAKITLSLPRILFQ